MYCQLHPGQVSQGVCMGCAEDEMRSNNVSVSNRPSMDESVKQNSDVRLVTDRDRQEWLMCLQASCSMILNARPYIAQGEEELHGPGYLADKLYCELRKRCAK